MTQIQNKKKIEKIQKQIMNFFKDIKDKRLSYLLSLIKQLLQYDSNRMDLMASYKFLFMLENNCLMSADQLSQFIIKEKQLSSQRISGDISKQHEIRQSYIFLQEKSSYMQSQNMFSEQDKEQLQYFATVVKQKSLILYKIQEKSIEQQNKIEIQKPIYQGSSIVSHRQIIYVLGGQDPQNFISSQKNLCYQIRRSNFQARRKILDDGRSFFGCAASINKNRIVLAGGYKKLKELGEHGLIYNPIKDAWFMTDKLLIHKNSPALCFTDRKVFIFGGLIVDQNLDEDDFKKIQFFQLQNFDSQVRCQILKIKGIYSNKYLLNILNYHGGLSFHLGNEKILLLGGISNNEQNDFGNEVDGVIIDFEEDSNFKISQIKEPRGLTRQHMFNNPGLFIDGKIYIDQCLMFKSIVYQGKFVSDGVLGFKSLNKS